MKLVVSLLMAAAVVAGGYARESSARAPQALELGDLPLLDPDSPPAVQAEVIRRTAEIGRANEHAARAWLDARR